MLAVTLRRTHTHTAHTPSVTTERLLLDVFYPPYCPTININLSTLVCVHHHKEIQLLLKLVFNLNLKMLISDDDDDDDDDDIAVSDDPIKPNN